MSMEIEEQIKQAAIERGCIEGTAEYFGFIQGARYAYQNPISPWISVEQRLPPIKIRVLFLDKNGKVWLGRNTIAMQAELETDENNNLLPPPTVPPAKPVITHWMPIPKLY